MPKQDDVKLIHMLTTNYALIKQLESIFPLLVILKNKQKTSLIGA